MNKHINTTHRQKGRYNIMKITKSYVGENPENGNIGELVKVTWEHNRHGLSIDSYATGKQLGDSVSFSVSLNTDTNRLGISVGSLSDATTDAFDNLSYWIAQYGYAEQTIIDDIPNVKKAFEILKG